MRVRLQLVLLLSLVAALVASTTFAVISADRSITRTTDDCRQAYGMVNDISALHLLAAELDRFNIPRVQSQWDAVMTILQGRIGLFPLERDLLAIREEKRLAGLAFAECVRLRLAELDGSSSRDYSLVNYQALNHLTILLNNLSSMADDIAMAGFARIASVRATRNQTLSGLAVVGIMLFGALLAMVWRGIMHPLRGMLEGITQVGRGNLAHRVQARANSANELHAMAHSFNAMVERLQKLVGSRQTILDAAENERTRIGRELHDSVSQTIAGVRLQLENMRVPAEQRQTIQKIASSLSLVQTEIQTIVKDLRPAMLDELGLLATLRWFQEQAQDTIAIDLFFDLAEKDIPIRLRTPIYRIAQEATSNAIHHGKASTIHIQLNQEDGMINVFFEDDGSGFDPSWQPTGNGLVNMRERVEAEQGELSIDSTPGRGCSIIVSLPVAKETP